MSPTLFRTLADRQLDGLNEDQRAAVGATSGPVAILAETRVINHRVAWAVVTGLAVRSSLTAAADSTASGLQPSPKCGR